MPPLNLIKYFGISYLYSLIRKLLSCNIVNAIRGSNLRALKRLNKGRKYNNNTSKDRNNRAKRLALLSWCPNK
jgi:hypothetical protein